MSVVKITHNNFNDTGFSVKSIAKKKNSLLQPTALATTWTAFNTTATPTTKIIKDSTRFGIYSEKLDEVRSQSNIPLRLNQTMNNFSKQTTD